MADNLVIEAETTWEIGAGAQGDVLEPFIVARIKDLNGEPVTGLKKSNFKVFDMGFGFSDVSIFVVQEIAATAPNLGILQGTYRLKLDLHIGIRGQLVFALVVNKSRPKPPLVGQALTAAVKLKSEVP